MLKKSLFLFLFFLVLISNAFEIAVSNDLNLYDTYDSPKVMSVNNSEDLSSSVLSPDTDHSYITEYGQEGLRIDTSLLMNKFFEHGDMDENKLALAGTTSTLGVFSPLLTKIEEGGIWVRPYSSFESVPVRNGPKVSNVMYGSFIGVDSPLKDLKNDWQVTYTGYVGYTGSVQTYNGVRLDQNSGLGGLTATFYKNDFFSAITATAGANDVASNNSQNIRLLSAGLITRTGYNFQLPHNLVIQPNYIMSYTYAKTFDYTKNNGDRIKTQPLNTIQITPSIRFYANLKDGLKPYIIVNMIFNLLDEEKVTANEVALPSISIAPFVEYGGGVQKSWKGRYSGFIQALIRNGGRNGIAFLAGFRWSLGK